MDSHVQNKPRHKCGYLIFCSHFNNFLNKINFSKVNSFYFKVTTNYRINYLVLLCSDQKSKNQIQIKENQCCAIKKSSPELNK